MSEPVTDEMAAERERLTASLRNLLAVINRDGGHRADTFPSLEAAALDAETTVVGYLAAVDRGKGSDA